MLWPVPATAQDSEDGAAIYQQVCAACHQPNAMGLEGTYPPLVGNPDITDPSFVAGVIRAGKQGPITVNGVDYDGVMPPIASLSDAQIEAVAAYVAGLGGGEGPPAPPTTIVAGDATRGDELFVGRTALTAGGPACGSCHTAGPHSGASLGPDLTDVFSRLGGKAGLQSWLASPPSPTMQPIFATHPLEDDEIGDLVAFLGSVDGTKPDRGPDVMLIGGAAGVVVLFGLMTLLFKRPRGRYVDQFGSTP